MNSAILQSDLFDILLHIRLTFISYIYFPVQLHVTTVLEKLANEIEKKQNQSLSLSFKDVCI